MVGRRAFLRHKSFQDIDACNLAAHHSRATTSACIQKVQRLADGSIGFTCTSSSESTHAEVAMLYRAVPKGDLAERLIHLRDLYRQRRPLSNREYIAQEKREAIAKNLLDNLYRTKDHPTLHTVLDVAEIFSLTLDGAHRLFGYNLDGIRKYDLELNGGRTHILDTYPYHRDFRIDLPLRLASGESLLSARSLPQLVREWQTDLPIRVTDDSAWSHEGTFYVHVGTRDSLGSSLPPGSMALVEPVRRAEQERPDPRSIYLLQFGNGYRCSRCVVTGKRLFLISDQRIIGQREFAYPGAVRIAGRVRLFALKLPLPQYPDLDTLPSSPKMAPLLLPWEHSSRDRLFQTKHQRFVRRRDEKQDIQDALQTAFAGKLSGRTERRYRRSSSSQPHIDTLIQMVLLNTTRYSDALRSGQALPSDRGRFSLETLLEAHSLEEIEDMPQKSRPPEPADSWRSLRDRYAEWPASLSMAFPNLGLLEQRIVRLPKGLNVRGLSPQLMPGSVLLLGGNPASVGPAMPEAPRREGWTRPLFALQRGAEILCGYLRSDNGQYKFENDDDGHALISLKGQEVGQLRSVSGVVVPL